MWRTFNNLKNLFWNGKTLNGTINANKLPLIFKSLQWPKIHLLKNIYIHSVRFYTVFLLAAQKRSLKTESMGVTLGRTHPWPLAQAAQFSTWGCLIVLSPLALNKHSSSVRESQWPPIHAQVECLKNAWEERKNSLLLLLNLLFRPFKGLWQRRRARKKGSAVYLVPLYSQHVGSELGAKTQAGYIQNIARRANQSALARDKMAIFLGHLFCQNRH